LQHCLPQITGSLGYIPKELVSVSDEDWEKNSAIIDALEALDEVDVVYHNMAN
jgi:transcriptional/translational regulatory protein YebC/TACO1